ncbi:hypothetical protein KIW84_034169 [Lathyrus oleraceus]|uniref:Uncharacterized protein n=1 Tax=Pisum sativum TaxID=3888 RepID=A0A9D5B4U6_PEA|nr:hypothetical protein KIW84_034169 [Pisum sativum]
MDKEHVIEEYYMTYELGSGVDEDSCDDMPALIRFNEEENLTKDFTFKVGMKFSSLKEFKETILENNILNGKEVGFAKNDSNRCKFFNKNAYADLVAKMIIDKLKNNTKMKLHEVVADVRLRFVTEIIGYKAFKDTKLARKVIKSMIPKRKQAKHVSIPNRQSGRLRILKTRDIVGPMNNVDNVVLGPDEEDTSGIGAKRNKA